MITLAIITGTKRLKNYPEDGADQPEGACVDGLGFEWVRHGEGLRGRMVWFGVRAGGGEYSGVCGFA